MTVLPKKPLIPKHAAEETGLNSSKQKS